MQSDAAGRETSAHATPRQDVTGGTSERDRSWEESVFRYARAAHERGALADAERGYLELLAVDPNHAEASHMLGVLRFQEGNLPEAEALIRRSIEKAPSPLALANHASVLANLGRHAESLDEAERALSLNPAHPRALLQRANVLMDLLRYEEAVAAYDRLLAVAPTFVDGLCRRSAALRMLNRLDEALASCDRALTIDGRGAAALAERGQVLHSLGRLDDAIESFGRALAVAPASVGLLYLRGLTFLKMDRLDLALASFNEAIAGAPNYVEAIYNSAVILERAGRFDEALARCDRVLAIDSSHAKALANRGNALQGLGRNAEAAESYTKSLELEPDVIEVMCNQVTALRRLNRREEALVASNRAVEIAPDYTMAWYSRGRVLQGLHFYDEALACFDRVLSSTPDDRFALFHRGNVLMTQQRFEEAKDAFGRAIEIDPDYVHAHCNRAFLCLSIADFRNGWEEYEWRWRDPQMTGGIRNFVQEKWTGVEPLEGKSILIYAEQGLGDTLQFCRYVPLVKALGATVVLEAQSELMSILATLPGVDQLIDRNTGAPLPPFDLYCPLLSLPLAFQTELATIPSDVPYLRADTTMVAKWQATLGPRTRIRIGLVWSGNPKHLNDRNRSIPLTSLLPLMSDAFEWVSLQKVVRDEDQEALASSSMRHFGDEIADFADTAALLETVDCLLSVDTSVAHLAGALGKPVWIMLPQTSDFRWLWDREDNPWYPQARLFRQSKAGDWTDVFERVVAALPSIDRPTGSGDRTAIAAGPATGLEGDREIRRTAQ